MWRKNEVSRPEASKRNATTILSVESAKMPSLQASDLSLDARQRRILFRSWHRGMREMDLVLGRFADAEIASLGSSELDDYELLLEAQDRDVFGWITGETEIPNLYDTPVLRKIRAFHSHAGPIHP
jgi:antitoxin CptB